MTRISIITPTYNAVKFIAECVENVAAQSVAGLEHIVMDGGSRDGTVEELERLATVHPHLRFVSEPDRGQSDAMNKGVARASADVIGFLNVDDYYEPGAIGEALAYLDQDPSLTMIVGTCRVINEDGSTDHWNRPHDLRPEALMLGWMYFQFPCNPSAYIYRKSVHDAIEYNVGDHYAMDFDFILAVAMQSKMRFVDRHWGNFRMLPGTKTFEDRANGHARTTAIIDKYKARLAPHRRAYMRALRMRIRTRWALGRNLRWAGLKR